MTIETKTKRTRLTKALLETADDMRQGGLMDAATHAKITLRHLPDKEQPIARIISGGKIRTPRE